MTFDTLFSVVMVHILHSCNANGYSFTFWECTTCIFSTNGWILLVVMFPLWKMLQWTHLGNF